MPDTVRSRPYLVTALADNTSGAITPQTIRDFLISLTLALIPTGAKTTNYSAAASDFIPVDTATTGSVTVTLPTAPADKTVVGVKMIAVSGSRTTTIAAGGSDVFNKAAGSTSLTLSLLNQAVLLQYSAAAAIWYVLADDLTLAALDARYLALSGGTVSGPQATTNGTLQVVNNVADQTSIAPATFIGVNVGAGHQVFTAIGKSGTTNNWVSLGFNYAGSGSTSNSFTVGFYGGSTLLTVTAAGAVSTAHNTLDNGSGNMTLASGKAIDVNGGSLVDNGTVLYDNGSYAGDPGNPKFYFPGGGGPVIESGHIYYPDSTMLVDSFGLHHDNGNFLSSVGVMYTPKQTAFVNDADRWGFYGATLINQPAAIADSTVLLTDVVTKFNTLLSKLRALGLIAT